MGILLIFLGVFIAQGWIYLGILFILAGIVLEWARLG